MKVEISAKTLKAIEELVAYSAEAEEHHYEEYIADGGDPATHIYSTVKKVDKWLTKIIGGK